MHSALAAALLATSLAAQPAAATTAAPAPRSLLIGSWRCRLASIKPSLSARLSWTARYDADGRYSWSGSSHIEAPELPFAIVYEIGKQGSWSLEADTLQHSIVEVSTANVTQPEAMNEERTAALRESIDQSLEIDQSWSNLLGPSSARILLLSAERLELLEAGSQEASLCRRTAMPEPAQAR